MKALLWHYEFLWGIKMFLLIAVIILSILYTKYGANIKGLIGELAVANRLSSLAPDQYQVINNVLIRTNYGSTQIDHVVVSLYGIFVIETKNYKGWITGDEFSEEWTKNMYGKKYRFRNPLKQNYAHVKALMSILEITDGSMFIPVVAFSSNSELKVKTNSRVIYINQIRSVIDSFQVSKLNYNDMNDIAIKIRNHNIDSKETRKEHVYSVENKVNANKMKVSNNICPKCGGNLIIRNGKYGGFKGCSNYPRCKFTTN